MDSPSIYSNRLPPRNRTETGLRGPLAIEIGDGEAVLRLDPNRAAEIGFKCDLSLGDPRAGASDLSGEPAYAYRTAEVELLLTGDELLRLLRRELEPVEFVRLRDKYGLFFEVHGDFYDLGTGEALQPMSLMAPDSRWEGAFELGAQMLDTHPDMEPTSAFRQAGADQGIPWGAPMGVFVRWALKTWGS